MIHFEAAVAAAAAASSSTTARICAIRIGKHTRSLDAIKRTVRDGPRGPCMARSAPWRASPPRARQRALAPAWPLAAACPQPCVRATPPAMQSGVAVLVQAGRRQSRRKHTTRLSQVAAPSVTRAAPTVGHGVLEDLVAGGVVSANREQHVNSAVVRVGLLRHRHRRHARVTSLHAYRGPNNARLL